MSRFKVEERKLSPRVQELIGECGPVYVVVDTLTGDPVPFGGYGSDKVRAQERALREENKINLEEE